jgi:hypothetical protein
MFTDLSRKGPWPRASGTRLGRLTAVLAAAACGVLAWATAVPAAFATPIPHPLPGGEYGPAPAAPVPAAPIRMVTAGGMAGWQIALIVAGAALVAAAAVMLTNRARAARRRTPAPAA